VAELVHRVITDEALKKSVLETQARAVRELRATDFGALLLERLGPVLKTARAPLSDRPAGRGAGAA
jgi:hypothetical protein